MSTVVVESPAPTFSASATFGLLILNEPGKFGICQRDLRRALGQPAEPLAPSESRLPIGAVRRLWTAAAQLSGSSAFGLQVAERLGVGELDLLDYLVRSSASWGDAIRRLVRFIPIVSDAGRFTLEIGRKLVRLRHWADQGLQAFSELAWGLVLLRGREFSGELVRPLSVCFMQRVRPTEAFDRVFQSRVFSEASFDEMVFSRDVLDIPFRTAEPRLCSILESSAQALLCAPPRVEPAAPKRAFSTLALDATLACLKEGNANIDRVAERLSLSVRSLQRYLRAEGTSHRRLLEDARLELTRDFEASDGLTQRELSRLLGYKSLRSVARRQQAGMLAMPAPPELRRRFRDRLA